MKRTILLLLAVAALFGCEKKSAPAPAQTATAAALPPGHPPVSTSAPPAPTTSGSKVTGTVAETFDAAGYTYLRLQTASGEQWAAVRQTAVKQGQTVTLDVQMTAEKFESKTLKRTFDRILFGTLAGDAAAVPQPHVMPAAPPDNAPIKVEKAAGSDAKSVAELWAARQSLKGGNVVVRGKVVKFLGGIMGKNWIHLRDGSGSQATGDNDITVTTNDTAAVGDVVTIRGVVHVDKDFGSGYSYPVIVEEASIVK